ncbi:NUDIX domain-containing protein [Candidatus Micrarchaeota archaeon]|nr:NUDIX domain-containing protein [Candidatus Micrarchaeota archaeon]
MQEFSSGAVVYRLEEGKPLYLILHYEERHWDFPKGKIEGSETLLETAKREIKEETGITQLEFDEQFKEKITYFYKHAGKTIFKQVDFFLARTTQEQATLSSEHTESEWLEFEKALERLTHENAKQLLKKANELVKQKKIETTNTQTKNEQTTRK